VSKIIVANRNENVQIWWLYTGGSHITTAILVMNLFILAVFVVEYRQSCRVPCGFSPFRWICRSVQCYSKVVSILLSYTLQSLL